MPKGVDFLTVKSIAQAGTFSTYPIYYNFSTIEGLQQRTVDLLIERLKESVPLLIDKDLRSVGKAVFDFIKDKPGLVQSFFANQNFYADFNQKIAAQVSGLPISQTDLQFNLAVIFSSAKFLHKYPDVKATQILHKLSKKIYPAA